MEAVLYKITNIPHEFMRNSLYFSNMKYELYSHGNEFAIKIRELFGIEDDNHLFDVFTRFPTEITIFKYSREIQEEVEFGENGNLKKHPTISIDIWNEKIHNTELFLDIIKLIYFKEIRVLYSISGIEEDGKFTCAMRSGKVLGSEIDPALYQIAGNVTADEFAIFMSANTNGLFNLVCEGFAMSMAARPFPIKFLGLMTAFDSLVGIGSASNYAIPRNCGVLLSKTIQEGHEISAEIKSLYKIRSAIVHEGQYSKAGKKEFYKLLYYFKESLKRIIYLDILEKKKMKSTFTELGYGSLNSF